MQVSQQDDFITHAVVGNQETISMGVSDDAALMHILSSTLYTFPKLAVVREVICNGWDAHIAAGITDKPLQISIKSNEITIRDFGFGISHNNIGPIYGVYGNSTKRDDSKSTGGFGLGSKAPFAYTDNFEVVSHHLGLKTVYRVSKSSMEKGGKPSINKIVSVPTTETGISVSFGIKEDDFMAFKNAIKEVLYLGEIKALINESTEPSEMLALSESKTGMMIFRNSGTLTDRVNVRYGNVVYPVPMHDDYRDKLVGIKKVLKDLWDNTSVVFQAAPDSISIAPNREAVILTDATVKTLSELMDTFAWDEELSQVAVEQQNAAHIKKLIKDWETTDLIKSIDNPSAFSRVSPRDQTKALDSIKKAFFQYAMSEGVHLSTSQINILLFRELKKREFVNRKLLDGFIQLSKTPNFDNLSRYTRAQERRRVLKKFQTYPHKKMLGLVEFEKVKKSFYNARGYYHGSFYDSIGDVISSAGLHAFFVKEAVIARSRKELDDTINRMYRHKFGTVSVFFTGTGKDSETRAANIEAVLVKNGYLVFKHFPEVIKAPRVKREVDPNAAPTKQKKKGTHLSLKDSFCPSWGTFLVTTARSNFSESSLIDKPIAYVVLRNKGDGNKHLLDLSAVNSQKVKDLLGDKIAVIHSHQKKKLEEEGVPDLKKFLSQHIDERLAVTNDIKRYAAFASHFPQDRYLACSVLHHMCYHEDLMKDLGLRYHISMDAAVLLEICEDIDGTFNQFPKCKEAMSKVKKGIKKDEIEQTYRSSLWLKFLDLQYLTDTLRSEIPNSPKAKISYEIIKNIFNKGN